MAIMDILLDGSRRLFERETENKGAEFRLKDLLWNSFLCLLLYAQMCEKRKGNNDSKKRLHAQTLARREKTFYNIFFSDIQNMHSSTLCTKISFVVFPLPSEIHGLPTPSASF